MKKCLFILFSAIAFVACSNEEDPRPEAAHIDYDFRLSENTLNTFYVDFCYSVNGKKDTIRTSNRMSGRIHTSNLLTTFEGKIQITPKTDATGNELSYSLSVDVKSVFARKGTEVDGGWQTINSDGYKEVIDTKNITDLQAFADSFNLASKVHSYVVSADGKVK